MMGFESHDLIMARQEDLLIASFASLRALLAVLYISSVEAIVYIFLFGMASVLHAASCPKLEMGLTTWRGTGTPSRSASSAASPATGPRTALASCPTAR